MIFFQLIFGLLVTFIVAACYIIMIAFTVWMVVDAGKQDRFWWLTVIIGVPIIGSAAYYFTEKKHEYTKAPHRHIHESLTEIQHEKSPKKKVVRKIKREHVSEDVVAQKEESNQDKEMVLEQNKEERDNSAQ
jgi:hypothetical protein